MNKLIFVVLLCAALQATYCSPVEYIQDGALKEEFDKGGIQSSLEATGDTVEYGTKLTNEDVNNEIEEENLASDYNDDKTKEKNPEYSGGHNIVEGDIRLTPVEAAIFKESGWEGLVKSEVWIKNRGLWPRFIPYTIAGTVGRNEQNALAFSIRLIQQNTCLRLIRRTNERDYLNFVGVRGCSSAIGKVGIGAQDIDIARRCTGAIPAHEILHALGRWHEQSRPDRDNFVRIEWGNIPQNQRHNFVKISNEAGAIQKTPYDYDSVMHYENNAFAINPRLRTITPLQRLPRGVVLGQRARLSTWDIKHINIKYCPERVIRLANGRNGQINEGRVEVFWNGRWGTVCGAGFDRNDGRTICRYLGFPDAWWTSNRADFGQGVGTIWFSNMQCRGDEPTPFECFMDNIGVNRCTHNQDASLICLKNVRLIDRGRFASAGRVEVYVNGDWGTVCSDSFGIEEARVICRQLGLPFGRVQALGGARYGQGRGPILMDDLQCVGNEQQIIHCRRNNNAHNCRHSQDASVVCQ